MITMKDSEFYKIEDVCELLQVSKITIYRWIKSGKIPAYKVGKSYLFKIVDVHKLIEDSKVDYEQ
jgi:putative molybdopterin biosynthesis protein